MDFIAQIAAAGTFPSEMTPERLTLFLRLHQLETWFRELVYVEMKSRYGLNWWTECQAALKRAKAGGIPPERAARNDSRHSHMATPENDPLWFISFDQLLKILFDHKLWKLFEPYLTTKQLVRAKFSELMPVRHRIAHCRALHQDDLARVVNIMRDFDQGIWRFCASYNQLYQFDSEDRDAVATHCRTSIDRDSGTTIDLSFIVRSSARSSRPATVAGQKGMLYSVRFVPELTRHRRFQTEEILKATKSRHAQVVHLLLDSHEDFLRVTIPAVLGASPVIELIDRFHFVCRHSVTSVPRLSPPDVTASEDSSWHAATASMRAVASQWPHYVVAPDNPLSFLDLESPCRFFGC